MALTALRQQLVLLEQAFTTPIALWSDDQSLVGSEWNATIEAQIDLAELFLLMLSPNYLASDYMRNYEFPAILARAREAQRVLVVPVIQTRCEWKPLVGGLRSVPMQNRRLLPVDEWESPARGLEMVVRQIEAAVRERFHLTPREISWFTPLLDQQQDPAGPMLVWRSGQLDLDPSGGEADVDACANPAVQQLHSPNRDKAAELSALVNLRHNMLGSEWAGLASALNDLAIVLRQPLNNLPAHVATLWERSVRVASFLLQDKRLLEKPETSMAPLDANIHTMLDDLIGSLGPWVRLFPTARMLDDQRGEFLRNKALFEPARRVIAQAAADAVVTPTVEVTIRSNIETAERGDAQAEKAGSYAIRGVRNTVVSAAGYAAGFLAGATASGYANHSPMIDNVGRWLANVERGITALVQDFPADLRLSIEHLMKTLHTDRRTFTTNQSLVPDIAMSSSVTLEIAQDGHLDSGPQPQRDVVQQRSTLPDVPYVFISSPQRISELAVKFANALEGTGIRNWIAWRDIRQPQRQNPPYGFEFGLDPYWQSRDQVESALRGSRAILLLFTGECNDSLQIIHELRTAHEVGISMVSILVENAPIINKVLTQTLGVAQWIDGSSELDRVLDTVVDILRDLLLNRAD